MGGVPIRYLAQFISDVASGKASSTTLLIRSGSSANHVLPESVTLRQLRDARRQRGGVFKNATNLRSLHTLHGTRPRALDETRNILLIKGETPVAIRAGGQIRKMVGMRLVQQNPLTDNDREFRSCCRNRMQLATRRESAKDSSGSICPLLFRVPAGLQLIQLIAQSGYQGF